MLFVPALLFCNFDLTTQNVPTVKGDEALSVWGLPRVVPGRRGLDLHHFPVSVVIARFKFPA